VHAHPPLTISTNTYVAERADTPHIFYSTPLCTLWASLSFSISFIKSLIIILSNCASYVFLVFLHVIFFQAFFTIFPGGTRRPMQILQTVQDSSWNKLANWVGRGLFFLSRWYPEQICKDDFHRSSTSFMRKTVLTLQPLIISRVTFLRHIRLVVEMNTFSGLYDFHWFPSSFMQKLRVN
jgi:hypothetical protein